MDIKSELFFMQDKPYGDFQAKLIPTLPREKMIGVRTPALRSFAKRLYGSEEAGAFLCALPHFYYEENNLHAFLLERIKSYDECIFLTERFLPYIDNWATCDMFLPPVFRKNTDALSERIESWLTSDKVYTVRYAVGLLMKLYLGDLFLPSQAEAVSNLPADEYYIMMMCAWYFAEALARRWDDAVIYLERGLLDPRVHAKAVSKAIESRKITQEQKKYLRELRKK